jgi:ABC-type glycerol-3-phosphate transport system permease component
MALYGLSVFLETPKELREGRRKYIALSFVFTLLTSITASADMASNFQILFRATSGTDFYKLVTESNSYWLRYLTSVPMAVGILVGDALLVSVPHRIALSRFPRQLTDF